MGWGWQCQPCAAAMNAQVVGQGWCNCFCALPSAWYIMTGTSTMTVPTVTATATTMTMQSLVQWGCRQQQHLHGVRWGHGGFPGQISSWDSA